MAYDPTKSNVVAEQLKYDLKQIEKKQAKLQEQMDELVVKKQQVLTELSKHTSQAYEEDMLRQVHEQRRQAKK